MVQKKNLKLSKCIFNCIFFFFSFSFPIPGITVSDEPTNCAFAGDHINATLVGIDINNVSVGKYYFIIIVCNHFLLPFLFPPLNHVIILPYSFRLFGISACLWICFLLIIHSIQEPNKLEVY